VDAPAIHNPADAVAEPFLAEVYRYGNETQRAQRNLPGNRYQTHQHDAMRAHLDGEAIGVDAEVLLPL
jgi:hypothetical protein